MEYKVINIGKGFTNERGTSYPVNILFKGEKATIWRSKKQLLSDLNTNYDVDDLSTLDRSEFSGGIIEGTIISHKKGEKYTYPDPITGEIIEKEYSSDILLSDEFLSIRKSQQATLANAAAKYIAAAFGGVVSHDSVDVAPTE